MTDLEPIVVNMTVESTEQEIPLTSVTETINIGSNYRLEFTDPNNDGNVVISEV